MMTQEEYMEVIALHRQGWTNRQIADALERHPATIAKWIEDGGPRGRREFSGERVIDERWQRRVGQLLAGNSELLATSIHRIITAEGFTGPIRPSCAMCARSAAPGVRRTLRCR